MRGYLSVPFALPTSSIPSHSRPLRSAFGSQHLRTTPTIITLTILTIPIVIISFCTISAHYIRGFRGTGYHLRSRAQKYVGQFHSQCTDRIASCILLELADIELGESLTPMGVGCYRPPVDRFALSRSSPGFVACDATKEPH